MTKDEFETLEQHKKEILKRLYQSNNKILKNIDVRLLDDYYLEALGENKISLISCYKEVQSKILGMSGKGYEIFCKCLNNYLNRTETDEWTTIAKNLLDNIEGYSELIESIEDIETVDIEKLSIIMQSNNFFDIKSVQDIERFESIKKKKCDEIIAGEGDFSKKKDIVIKKIFGFDLEYAESIVNKFGEDITKIEESDEKNLVLTLSTILKVKDNKTLRKMYEESDEVLVNKAMVERNLKSAYGKQFNKGLYSLSPQNKIKDEQLREEFKGLDVYDAGTDFKMIITSIAPFIENQPEDFRKDWNRASIDTQHFSATYIRNDMIGTTPIPHLCYGFIGMKEDSLMLSAPSDIGSRRKQFVADAYNKEKYYSPDMQINSTSAYNEMDFRRIQDGVKKQPDYIVAFQRNKSISNIDKILQGVRDWGGKLPIVIVDIDRCLKKECYEVYEMLDAYIKTDSLDIAKEILQKVKNNRCTDGEFCTDIQTELDDIEWRLREENVRLQDLQENYSRVTASERREMVSVMANIRKKIEEIVK